MSVKKKKILIITPIFPYPITSGGQQAQFHFIDKLRFLYDISILFNKDSVKDVDFEGLVSLWPNVVFYPFKSQNISDQKQQAYSVRNKIIDFIRTKIAHIRKHTIVEDERSHSNLYRSLFFWFKDDFVEHIYNISHKNFDIIQVEFTYFLPLIHLLPKNVERIFIHHEIGFVRNELEKSFFKDNTIQDEYVLGLSKTYELANLECYDKIVTLSDTDNNKLKKELRDDHRIITSPALVKQNIKIDPPDFIFNNRLVFLGSAEHLPNKDGISWFILNVWPLVRKLNSKLELHLIGEHWLEYIDTLGCDLENIFTHGFITNLEDILSNSIMIVPIRIGSGIRIKILDAINNHIPIVTTSIGKEGLDLEDLEDCLIADNIDSFAHRIIDLAGNIDLARTLVKGASNKIRMNYSEDNLLQRRINVYES